MRRVRTYSGVKTPDITPREIKHREIARRAASQGFVLMKNEGILPIKEDAKVFLAGNGAVHPIKGGTGSGDVNEREVVDVLTGLLNSGVEVVNAEEVTHSIEDYGKARMEYRDAVLGKIHAEEVGSGMDIFGEIFSTKQREYAPIPLNDTQIKAADICIYIISRIAGEGRDRETIKGDYFLSDREVDELRELAKYSKNIAVLINTGGQIDLKEIEANSSVKAILNISQPGMELGNAVADVLIGKVTPSGKLTSTWSVNYEDFPNAKTYSHNNGDVENELYVEDIYVGYRYFDSFGVKPLYPFGYGLSYTKFAISEAKLSKKKNTIEVSVRVTNIGEKYSGAEVVQLYAACPQDTVKKELKRLVGFAKTSVLAPGKSQVITISLGAKNLAYFDENCSSWLVDEGNYIFMVGNSSENVAVCGIVEIPETVVMETVEHIHPLEKELSTIERPDEIVDACWDKWMLEAADREVKAIEFNPEPEEDCPQGREDLDDIAYNMAQSLTDDELVAILMGEITKGQDNLKDNELVETGIYVPGAAGETTCKLEEKYDLPAISLADGPAGIRLMRSYDVDRESGKIYSEGLLSAIEGGLFAKEVKHENADTYYQYATAIPIGTHLAQTFDVEIVRELGILVANEMVEFGVSWWLAPGMNIHRNPLCGRNFEYYSEDPLVAGCIAAAMTLGVQSIPGVGTTIKHFACNNQEDNRMGSDSIVSERALREIYLRGFEIAVKTSQPMCIMTTYNLINGIHTANSYDLCTIVAREEWGFEGVIMTDWTTTTNGGSISHVCAIAGNDLIMPANQKDVDDIKAALKNGSLPRATARECAARLIRVILQTSGMADCQPYKDQFGF